MHIDWNALDSSSFRIPSLSQRFEELENLQCKVLPRVTACRMCNLTWHDHIGPVAGRAACLLSSKVSETDMGRYAKVNPSERLHEGYTA